jgi:hypothetical protein
LLPSTKKNKNIKMIPQLPDATALFFNKRVNIQKNKKRRDLATNKSRGRGEGRRAGVGRQIGRAQAARRTLKRKKKRKDNRGQ